MRIKKLLKAAFHRAHRDDTQFEMVSPVPSPAASVNNVQLSGIYHVRRSDEASSVHSDASVYTPTPMSRSRLQDSMFLEAPKTASNHNKSPTSSSTSMHLISLSSAETESTPAHLGLTPIESEDTPPQPTDMDIAMAQLASAQLLLEQRHANIKTVANVGKKISPKKAETEKTEATSSVTFMNNVPVPHLTQTTHPQPRRYRSRTANDAVADRQRRELVKKVAYDAFYGCPKAAGYMAKLTAYMALESRQPGDPSFDTFMDIDGHSVEVSRMGIAEHNWIQRYNTAAALKSLKVQRILVGEDYDQTITQIFPEYMSDLLRDTEAYEILAHSLAEEGLIKEQTARDLSRLQVTIEEFRVGGGFRGQPSPFYFGKNANKHTPFVMPKSDTAAMFYHPHAAVHRGPDLSLPLALLTEAAVYRRTTREGNSFTNPRADFDKYFQAWKISEEGWLLPPTLTAYKRYWRYEDTRVLQRGAIILSLLDDFSSGKITDFGVISAIRGTFVHVSAQRLLGFRSLQSLLYARGVPAGLSTSLIPEIMMLHPDNDKTCANPTLRAALFKSLKETERLFVKEEKEREAMIETSKHSYNSLRKSQMSRWERVKAKCAKLGDTFGGRKVWGKEKKAMENAFDPWCPSHDGGAKITAHSAPSVAV